MIQNIEILYLSVFQNTYQTYYLIYFTAQMLLNAAGVGLDNIMIHFNELTMFYMLLCPKMIIYASKKTESIFKLKWQGIQWKESGSER